MAAVWLQLSEGCAAKSIHSWPKGLDVMYLLFYVESSGERGSVGSKWVVRFLASNLSGLWRSNATCPHKPGPLRAGEPENEVFRSL
jgi:hypothetical protein